MRHQSHRQEPAWFTAWNVNSAAQQILKILLRDKLDFGRIFTLTDLSSIYCCKRANNRISIERETQNMSETKHQVFLKDPNGKTLISNVDLVYLQYELYLDLQCTVPTNYRVQIYLTSSIFLPASRAAAFSSNCADGTTYDSAPRRICSRITVSIVWERERERSRQPPLHYSAWTHIVEIRYLNRRDFVDNKLEGKSIIMISEWNRKFPST